ncbi:Smr domain-containing protein [Stagonosporopsis vannaccii]|nr:Smr domain-containing protein [Stagonosporopsis vannaccii]
MDEHLRILEVCMQSRCRTASLTNLQQEYCPPIDPALVAAFYSDFADAPNALERARELLDPIKASAIAEQATDFDASGSSGGPARDSPGKHSSDVDSNADTWATRTTLTDATHLSNDFATLSVDGRSAEGSEGSWDDGGYYKDTEQFDIKTKEQLLAETFPNLRPELVAYTLRKCSDDFSKATDELLNHAYFEDARSSPSEEAAPVAKGIDAFFEGHHVPQKSRKGKGKKKQKDALYQVSSANSSGTDLSGTATPNRWQNSSRDIGFITARTKLPTKAVSSLYHEKGASLSAAILAFVNKDMKAHEGQEPEAGSVEDAMALNADFPSIGLNQAVSLVRLADGSSDKARDLAKALTEQPASETGGKGGIKLDLRYAPVNLEDDEPQVGKLPDLPSSIRPHSTASVALRRNEAFEKAASAHRRGGYMKAAAGYYAQEGRNYNANLKVMSQADADAFVAHQSSSTILDLHGVTVADAIRIARQRTKMWWDSLGEQRIAEYGGARGGVGSYRIVVGLGRHSADGRGKLGPAVVKALVKEGWKVEVGSGELLVTGVSKRR